MSKPKNLSPISIIEAFLFEKIKNTPFKVWHYYAALFVLCIVPALISSGSLQPDVLTLLIAAIIVIAWMSSRLIGRSLARSSGVDSVLIYRFFAVTPWIIGFISAILTLLVQQPVGMDLAFLYSVTVVTAIALTLHAVGIIIHFKKRPTVVKGIKKEDLFQ